MQKLLFIIFLLIVPFIADAQWKPGGIYNGMEKMTDWSDPSGKKIYTDKENPSYSWYHLSTITFKEDSVFLEQAPVFIDGKDTVSSASDGGFYFYTGVMKNVEGIVSAQLILTYCEYCLEEKQRPSGLKKKTLVIKPAGDERKILVNQIIYTK